MNPVLITDPASLTLWYDPQLIHQSAYAAEYLAEAVHDSMFGDSTGLENMLTAAPSEEALIRCASLVGSVWHEHRHFLDLVLTNYGAFRVRQFFTIYLNVSTIIDEAREAGGTLACPLDMYLDPVRCGLLGIAPLQGPTTLASDVLRRKDYIRTDRTRLPTHFGKIEVGGEAQLEAMGFFCQLASVQEYFGPNLCTRAQRDLPDSQRFNLKYRWAYEVLRIFGMLPHEISEDVAVIDHSFLLPIVFASLMCRVWGQDQVRNESGASGYPCERFAGFVLAFKGKKYNYATLSVEQSWELVNSMAERMWGRTVLSELEEDYKREGEWFETLTSGPVPISDTVKNVLRDFHTLRGRLIDILKKTPVEIIDPSQYSKNLLFRILPIPVVCSAFGSLGDPPPGWERVFGYQDVDDPNLKWWWASVPKTWPVCDEPALSLQDKKSWANVVSYFSPFAKLMLNGYRHRTMLGPELLSIERQLHTLGIDLRIDPLFGVPKELDDISPYYYLTAKSTAICDLCKAAIKKPEGHLLSPWVFRYSLKNGTFAINAYGGGAGGQRAFWKDWSPWVICSGCMSRLKDELDWP